MKLITLIREVTHASGPFTKSGANFVFYIKTHVSLEKALRRVVSHNRYLANSHEAELKGVRYTFVSIQDIEDIDVDILHEVGISDINTLFTGEPSEKSEMRPSSHVGVPPLRTTIPPLS